MWFSVWCLSSVQCVGNQYQPYMLGTVYLVVSTSLPDNQPFQLSVPIQCRYRDETSRVEQTARDEVIGM